MTIENNLPLPARTRAQLSASGIQVSRGGRTILHNVNLTVTPQSRWGVVGENGRGKSTLLHVLAGTLKPDAGTVHLHGTIGVAEQEMPLQQDDPTTASGTESTTDETADRTVGDLINRELAAAHHAIAALDQAAQALAEGTDQAMAAYESSLNACEVLDAWDADRRVDIALEALGAVTNRDRHLNTLSVGQRYRVRLACLLGAGHDFLLLDEPTNHLDQSGLDYLTRALNEHPGGVLVVSHDRALLGDVATSIIDLDPSVDGEPRIYGDGYAGYLEGRRAERERWQTAYDAEQQERKRLEENLDAAQDRLISGWRPPKGTGKHTRATRAPALVRNLNQRQDELDRHAITMPEPPLEFRMPTLPERSGVTLIRAKAVTVTGRLSHPASLALNSGDRMLITGPNGAGKSTLLHVLAGNITPTSGEIHFARKARIRLLRQESPPAGKRTSREIFDLQMGQLISRGILADMDYLTLADLGLLRADEFDKPFNTLSMGQQRRLDIAVALAERPHALLLDEPTNHLSIALVEELTEALKATEAAVVIASHDRQLKRDLDDWPQLKLRH